MANNVAVLIPIDQQVQQLLVESYQDNIHILLNRIRSQYTKTTQNNAPIDLRLVDFNRRTMIQLSNKFNKSLSQITHDLVSLF